MTGQLGKKESQLGQIQLASILIEFSGIAVSQDIVEVLYVDTSSVLVNQVVNELIYSSDPVSETSQHVIEIIFPRLQALNLSQDVVEVLDTYDPSLQVSQSVIEFLQVSVSTSHISQYVSEVLYQINPTNEHYYTTTATVAQIIGHSSLINRTVISTIAVHQIVGGGEYSRSVTTNVAVASTIVYHEPVKHLSVTTTATVTQTIFQTHPTEYSKTITSNIGVASIIEIPARNVHQAITSLVHVDSEIIESNRIISRSITSNVSVSQAIAFRNTVIRISVSSLLNASQIADDPYRKDLGSDVFVSSVIFARSTVVRLLVINTINLTQVIFATHTEFEVFTNVTVTQTILAQTQLIELSVVTDVTVISAFKFTPLSLNVTTPVTVFGSSYPGHINFYISPVRWPIYHALVVEQSITGGSSNRKITVETPVQITSTIRTNYPENSSIDVVFVTQSIVFGTDLRIISLIDTVIVSQIIDARNTVIRLDLITSVFLETSIINTTQEIFLDLEELIIAISTITPRIVPYINWVENVIVNQIIICSASTNRQSVINAINVDSHFRYSPVSWNLTDMIHVGTKLRRGWIDLTTKVTVAQKIQITRTQLIIQKPILTDSVTVSRILNRSVTSNVTVNQNILAGHIYVRNIVDYLPIDDQEIRLIVDFNDTPIVIPVVTGVIVNARQMILQSIKGVIVLPPALFGDSIQNIGHIDIKKAMDGTTRSFIQGTTRKKLTYQWKLSHLKAYELRQFVSRNMSEIITITDWNGIMYKTKITLNPFEFGNQGVYEKDREFAEVSMEFEGVKIS